MLAAPAQGFKQDVFTLSEGDVVLRWPEGLSSESFEDLKDWLEIMQKKIARAAGVEEGGRSREDRPPVFKRPPAGIAGGAERDLRKARFRPERVQVRARSAASARQ